MWKTTISQWIKSEIRAKLKENTHERWEESTTGKINPNKVALARVTDAIFKQKIPNSGKKYNVEMLVDVSGSMFVAGSGLCDAIKVAQELVSYFYWVIDVNVTFFNLLEYKKKGREVLRYDLSKWDSKLGNENFRQDVKIKAVDGRPQFVVDEEGNGNYNACAGNWEVCNIVSASERLESQDGNNMIIIIWDGAIHVDYFGESVMAWKDLHFSGQPVSKYGASNYVETVRRIQNNWVPILPICIGGSYYNNYFDNAKTVYDASECGHIILDFLNQFFKK